MEKFDRPGPEGICYIKNKNKIRLDTQKKKTDVLKAI